LFLALEADRMGRERGVERNSACGVDCRAIRTFVAKISSFGVIDE
jgi:hypothetical protein